MTEKLHEFEEKALELRGLIGEDVISRNHEIFNSVAPAVASGINKMFTDNMDKKVVLNFLSSSIGQWNGVIFIKNTISKYLYLYAVRGG